MGYPDVDVSAAIILAESAALVTAWARLAVPHYGPTGSMDADLAENPDAQGPSYYNQLAHWPLLLLSEGVLPGLDDAAERERFRQCALRNIDYMLGITGADFMTPHYSRGRDWGRHVGEWSNYFLLRSLSLMETRRIGPPELRARLSRSIRGATARIYDSFSRTYGDRRRPATAFPGNHAVWHALLCYEAGLHFGETPWADFAADFFRRQVLPFQDGTGCWPEGGGVVVNYAMVSAQAVSLYAESADDPAALTAVGRFLSFLQVFAFPDGSSPVAAECRMRYSSRPMVFLPPSFVRTPAGRAECRRRIRGFATQLGATRLTALGVQGLAFFSLFPEFIVRRGDSLPVGLATAAVTGVPAARLETGPWTAFLSWQLTPEHPSRFILDAQNFVELYHAGSGYLIGGGNSKYTPRFSTLRRRTSGRAYIPDAATPRRQTGTAAVAAYTFGPDVVEVRVTVAAEGAEIGFRMALQALAADAYEGAVTLRLAAGEVVGLDDGEVTVVPTAQIERSFGPSGGRLVWRGRTFQVPPGSCLSYPLVPHNPYRQDGLPPTEEYVARLALPLSNQEQVIRVS